MEKIEVVQEQVKVLNVTVLRATRVTVSNLSDKLDIPDPYVVLRNINSPNAKQKTIVKDNDVNPTWNEIFTFYLNVGKKNVLSLVMKDKNVGVSDSFIGRATVELDDLPMNEEVDKVVPINKKTLLYINLLIKFSDKKDLRFSRELCDNEIEFIKKRKEKVFTKMQTLLPKPPKKVKNVPTIAILGSGGGYRALCGLSGAFCALQETGILDCATYVAGLSGSSWYISTLYSHEGWPHNASCEEVGEYLKERFDTKLSSHFHHLDFRSALKSKRNMGQPVTMTDLIGMALGDALLQNQLSKLSNQIIKLDTGKVPLPICTALNVRKAVSAETFSEWMEFTPYEFGMVKYGIFAKTSDFGSKFYKGHLVTRYDEAPLHYLQGIWGSAFSILLNRVIGDESEKKPKKGSSKVAKEYFINNEVELIGRGDEDVEKFENEIEFDDLPKEKKLGNLQKMRNAFTRGHGGGKAVQADKTAENQDEGAVAGGSSVDEPETKSDSKEKNKEKKEKKKLKKKEKKKTLDQNEDEVFVDAAKGEPDDKIKKDDEGTEKKKEKKAKKKMKEKEKAKSLDKKEDELVGAAQEEVEDKSKNKRTEDIKEKKEKQKMQLKARSLDGNGGYGIEDEELVDAAKGAPEDKIKKKFWLKDILTPGKIFKSRQGRAAEVLNVFRGLKFKVEVDGKVEPCCVGLAKTMCLVDSGLAFNSPYPVIIRRERHVDLMLSFDFSQRDEGDNSLPFEELIKAEKWAKANNIPFPPIADNPVTKETDIRECYVFENPRDPKCPTILHFVLINKSFKEYKAPGVARETAGEKSFGDFPIFDDPAQPYSSFTFQYNNYTFDRLHNLMKYNTLLNIDLIKEKIADCIKRGKSK